MAARDRAVHSESQWPAGVLARFLRALHHSRSCPRWSRQGATAKATCLFPHTAETRSLSGQAWLITAPAAAAVLSVPSRPQTALAGHDAITSSRNAASQPSFFPASCCSSNLPFLPFLHSSENPSLLHYNFRDRVTLLAPLTETLTNASSPSRILVDTTTFKPCLAHMPEAIH